MEVFAMGLFAVAVIGIPIAILLLNNYGSKRGVRPGVRHLRQPGDLLSEEEKEVTGQIIVL